MAVGRVKQMHWWVFNTPNRGVLIDLETGIEYPFSRPPIETPGPKAPKWNVKQYDIVEFDIINNKAENVQLYKKHVKGRIYHINKN